jgi:tripartite-type tricarboxylate transporter receptor subunit TctC
MRKLLFAVACTAVFCGAGIGEAHVYPSRPITIVVPYAAGGGSDTLARIIGERIGTSLGQPIIIENVAGAAGSIGTGRVARATSDGYTLGLGNWSTHVANGAVYALPYSLLGDFEPISLIASSPLLIAAKKSMTADTLKDLIAWLKANPDKATSRARPSNCRRGGRAGALRFSLVRTLGAQTYL